MSSSRPYCSECLRPIKTCFCDLVLQIENKTPLIIWQHPSEKNHPKGTAQLLHMCLKNSELVVGEYFSPEQLRIDVEYCGLLYPNQTTSSVERNTHSINPKQLLLLDSTWRKSRKLIYSNPWLTSLQKISLSPEPGNYRIRKPETHFQLSTFEAGCLALDVLGQSSVTTKLAPTFEIFIQRWEQFVQSN